jgi:peptide/nickel transport system permease protein
MAKSQVISLMSRQSRSSARRFVLSLKRFVGGLFRKPQSAIGTIIVIVFLVLTLFGPMIAPYNLNDQNHAPRQAPNAEYPFGTDYLGRDVYSRVVLGAQSIFWTAGLGTIIAVTLGTLLGLFSAYQGGIADEIISRLIDAFLALPALLIALVILGVLHDLDIERGSWQATLADNSVLLVISLVYVPIVARVVRSVTLDIKTREFVQAAQTQGESRWYIMLREIFPSVIPALVVEASLRFSYAIFLVASLGFLGVGAKPPSPDWGLMVNENRSKYSLTPWALEYPALAIAILVIGVNLMSDGIRRVVQKGDS